MKFIFILNSCTQPRCHKRIRMFQNLGITFDIYSFDRGLYEVNLPVDLNIHILGKINSGSNYLKRMRDYYFKIKDITNKYNSDTIFYAFGTDIAFVLKILGKKYIYEESDLMYVDYNFLLKNVFKYIDINLHKTSICSILTSGGFCEYLDIKYLQKTVIIPNKVSNSLTTIQRPVNYIKNKGKLRYAFVGLLRYPKTIFQFIDELLLLRPNDEFHFWGDGSINMKNKISSYDNNKVIYHGPFRNPENLFDIYNSFDINFMCYDTTGNNEKIAEPNKLYESLFFNKPCIVSEGTYLSKQVKKYGNGYSINCHNINSIREFILNLDTAEFNNMITKSSKVDFNEIVDNDIPYNKIIKIVSKHV